LDRSIKCLSAQFHVHGIQNVEYSDKPICEDSYEEYVAKFKEWFLDADKEFVVEGLWFSVGNKKIRFSNKVSYNLICKHSCALYVYMWYFIKTFNTHILNFKFKFLYFGYMFQYKVPSSEAILNVFQQNRK
jgi:hypothetical protein